MKGPSHLKVPCRQDQNPTWAIDAMQCGSVSRFINHSCDANLYVQPVIAGHSEVPMASIALFSSRVIAPFDEVCYVSSLP